MLRKFDLSSRMYALRDANGLPKNAKRFHGKIKDDFELLTSHISIRRTRKTAVYEMGTFTAVALHSDSARILDSIARLGSEGGTLASQLYFIGNA